MAECNKPPHAPDFQNSDLFGLFAGKLSDMVTRYDSGLHIIYANPAFEKFTGLTSTAIIGKTHAELAFGAEIVPHWDNILAEVTRTCKSATTDFTCRVHAETLYFQSWAIPEVGSDGSLRSVITVSRDITIRNSVEKALGESEAGYRELVEYANSIILRIDTRGRITFLNDFALRFFGFKAEEILGRNVVGTIMAEMDSSGNNLREMMEDMLKNPERYTNKENENVLRDGTRVWIAWTNKFLEDENGTFSGLLCIGNDLTERKRAEEALQESEAKYRQLFEMESDAILLIDNDTGRIIEANSTAASLYGYSREELLLLNDTDLSSEPEQTCTDRLEQKVKVPVRLNRKKSESIFPAEITARYFSWKGRRVHISAVRNIIEAQRAREAMEAARRQLTDIIEFLPDATFVIDREGKVIAWNRAIEIMTGVPKEKMLGRGDYAYSIPFYGKRRPILIDLVMESNEDHVDLYALSERQGKLLFGEMLVPETYGGKGAYLWGTASPLYDMNGTLIGAVEAIRDITERKQLESALLNREAELEEKAHQLEEINTALKVLLKRREEDARELGESILSNVKESVFPFLEKLKRGHLDENQKTYLELVESQLDEIVSPFLKNLSAKFANLTPMEIKVANLIKEGKLSKEIAEILGVAEQTVLTHRNNLRSKLGLRNQKANLRSHLMSLT
ncbi:MAG: PAS domain S-box protein [Syntrophobacteraceae bacterium]